MHVRIEHIGPSGTTIHLDPSDDDPIVDLADALDLAENAGKEHPVWLHGTTPERATFMTSTGRGSDRTLLQMRVKLPVEAPTISTRSFTEADIEDFVGVNNRAFHWHPEQSGLTPEAVRANMAESWFSADGFRLFHEDHNLVGFCWTKIHSEPEPLGEIYVIAVDPSVTGRGLGKQMTLAGLDWLSEAGLTTGMLYVESDNEAAVATYERIGFRTHRSDTLWTSTHG